MKQHLLTHKIRNANEPYMDDEDVKHNSTAGSSRECSPNSFNSTPVSMTLGSPISSPRSSFMSDSSGKILPDSISIQRRSPKCMQDSSSKAASVHSSLTSPNFARIPSTEDALISPPTALSHQIFDSKTNFQLHQTSDPNFRMYDSKTSSSPNFRMNDSKTSSSPNFRADPRIKAMGHLLGNFDPAQAELGTLKRERDGELQLPLSKKPIGESWTFNYLFISFNNLVLF